MARYRARPVEVEAFQITHVSHHLLGHHTITLDNGDSVTLDPGQISRRAPVVGDYFVRTSTPDVYEYLNPGFVFEAKYELIGTPAETSVSQLGPISAAQEKPRNDASEVAPENGVKVIVPAEQPSFANGLVANSGIVIYPAALLEAEPASDEEQAALGATNAGLVSSKGEPGVVDTVEAAVAPESSTAPVDELAHTN